MTRGWRRALVVASVLGCAAPCASAGDISPAANTPARQARLDTSTPRRLVNGARLDWVPCWFEASLGEDARCAHFFPSAPAGAPAVRLPVVVLKSVLPDTRDSPLLYLPPGPGSATGLTDRGLAPWWHWQGLARWPHDLVLFDVRGAGLAQPRLDCPEIVAADRGGLDQPLTADEDLRALQAAAAQCHRRLRESGIDVRAFSTERQVGDIGELMALLGRNDWNLWGVSYGTRLALHAAREFPERIRSMTLDSAYPPEVNGLLAKPAQFAAIAPTLTGACARDPPCAREHPALARQLDVLLRRLSAQPVVLELEKWPGVWRHRLVLNDYRLLWLLFLESYDSPLRPRAPAAVAGALAGNHEPLRPLAERFVESLLDPDASHGLYYSTVCPEDLPGVTREAYLAEAERHPTVARHLRPEWGRHVCHAWDAGTLPARYRQPVRSALPTLFLNGADDIVTPPAWAVRSVRGFRGGHQQTFPGSSHAVTWENGCAMEFVWEFLAEPRRAPAPACRRGLAGTRGR